MMACCGHEVPIRTCRSPSRTSDVWHALVRTSRTRALGFRSEAATNEIQHVHHITLRVSDLERSRRFYSDVLGFDVEVLEDRLRLTAGPTRLILRSPLEGTPADDRFSERRIGLDHISFGVDDRLSLERFVERLGKHGVATVGIEVNPDPKTEFVAFRDPDDIQLEFILV
jgi:glyoxylase I family protein